MGIPLTLPLLTINQQGANLNYSERLTGRHLREQPTSTTVGATVTRLIDNDADRMELIVFNLGTQDAFMWIDSSVSATNGIKLASGGGFAVFKINDDYTLITREWFFVSPGAGTTNISILELIAISSGNLGA